jgi:hypothetical protein
MCYYFAMQHLSYHNPNPWPVFIQQNDLNTGLFTELVWGVGIYKKGPDTILSVERWQMVVGDKKFGVVSYVLVGGSGGIVPLLGLKCEYFLKQIFGYTTLHCALIDRIWSVKCTCMVCLCKYHNWVTQDVESLLTDLVDPTPTGPNHGRRRAGKFWKFWVSRSLEMAFSESSFVIIEIRTLDYHIVLWRPT